MTLSIGTTTTYPDTGGNGTGHSFTATVDASANAALLLIGVGNPGTGLPAVSALSLGGSAMTLIPGASSVRSTFQRTEAYYLFSPPTGNQTVALTLSSVGRPILGLLSIIGLDTSSEGNAFGAASTSQGTGNPSLVISSAVGQVVLDAGCDAWPDTDDVTAGQTLIYDVRSSLGGGGGLRGWSQQAAGAASVTMSWTKSGGNSGWAYLALALRPSGGPTGTLAYTMPMATTTFTGTVSTPGGPVLDPFITHTHAQVAVMRNAYF